MIAIVSSFTNKPESGFTCSYIAIATRVKTIVALRRAIQQRKAGELCTAIAPKQTTLTLSPLAFLLRDRPWCPKA